MKRRYRFGMLLALLQATAVSASAPPPPDRPVQSAHRAGPSGLEGWTLDSPVPGSGYGDERFAFKLLISRHGHVIRRVSGDPVIWKWVFWADGKQIAYETGPLHFGLNCVLIRLSDGRRLENHDCYRPQAAPGPGWVKALLAAD